MPKISILDSAFQPNTTDQSQQQLINFYLEEAKGVEGGGLIALPTPGYSTYHDYSGNEVRGMIEHKGIGYVVVDNTFYKITDVGSVTTSSIGTINTSSGRVSLAAIDDEILLTDGADTWSYTVSTPAFAVVNDVDLPADATIVVATQDYFIVPSPGTNTFYVSDLTDGTSWTATSFASAEIYYDRIVSLAVLNTKLWVFCETSTEVWYNSGATTGAPFDRVPGGAVQYGCAAKFTPAIIDADVYWLAQTKEGVIGIMRGNESRQELISTRAMIQEINSYDTISDAYSWTYSLNGHFFYIITFPTINSAGDGKTWMYDVTTNIWSRLESNNEDAPVTPNYDRHTANCHMYVGGYDLIGDFNSGKIYRLKSDTYLEDTSAIRRIIISPHITADRKLFTMSNVDLDVDSGVGLDGSGQGSDPLIAMQYSKDFGHTYGSELYRSPGQLGEYNKRALWTRLGTGRAFTLKFTFSDPIPWRVLGIWADVEAQAVQIRTPQ